MSYIKVTDFQPKEGSELLVTGYPHAGLFRITYCGSKTLVYVGNGCCYWLGLGSADDVLEADHTQTQNGPSPSENFVLKLVAISQKPELAEVLTKGVTNE